MPFRADGFALRAFRSPGSRIAAYVSPSRGPGRTSVAFSGRRLPAHSCATAPALNRIPLVPCGDLSFLIVPGPHG